MHGYSEVFYVELRLESVTPTALKRSFYIMIHISLCLYLWRIAPKKRDTYGVEEYYSSYNLRHFIA